MSTRTTLCICLWFAVVAPCLAQDPYPAYMAQLAAEINAKHASEAWSYWGTKTDKMGWTDYYLIETANGGLVSRIHVPKPGAKLDAAFIGDSTIDIITLYDANPTPKPNNESVMPELATLNAGIGADTCAESEARLPEIAALAPSTIVIGCGNTDAWSPATPDMAETKTALLNIMAEGREFQVPIIIGTLTPILSVTPTVQTTQSRSPSIVAKRIRTFNTWLRVAAVDNGDLVWNRWGNIAAGTGDYGIHMCFPMNGALPVDGIHPANCGQMQAAGLRYLIAEDRGKTN
ncbi:MAG TPA: hypothetical protein VG267_12960 [Terracidiphilus sp.]|jgi:hypothetical protein|nr:hypothetical protein [Terracidiphilus sp.]